PWFTTCQACGGAFSTELVLVKTGAGGPGVWFETAASNCVLDPPPHLERTDGKHAASQLRRHARPTPRTPCRQRLQCQTHCIPESPPCRFPQASVSRSSAPLRSCWPPRDSTCCRPCSISRRFRMRPGRCSSSVGSS